jgi:hypothetical protein
MFGWKYSHKKKFTSVSGIGIYFSKSLDRVFDMDSISKSSFTPAKTILRSVITLRLGKSSWLFFKGGI